MSGIIVLVGLFLLLLVLLKWRPELLKQFMYACFTIALVGLISVAGVALWTHHHLKVVSTKDLGLSKQRLVEWQQTQSLYQKAQHNHDAHMLSQACRQTYLSRQWLKESIHQLHDVEGSIKIPHAVEQQLQDSLNQAYAKSQQMWRNGCQHQQA